MQPLQLALLLAVMPLSHGNGVRNLFCLAKVAPETCFEERLLADADDGRLDEHSLLDAALVASGVQHADALRPYQQRLDAWIDELQRRRKAADTPRRRAQTALEFMHRRILRGGYDVNCTDLRLAFDQGRFNCVSATVLYNCLAEELGLAVCGLETPGHAMSRLILPEGPFDVETTCPRWFRLKDDPQKQAALIAEAMGSSCLDDRLAAREVSPVEMTAMIYYNRGVDLLAEQRFAEAAAANVKALRLDPSNATARGNLLATLNNWAITLGNSGRYAEAGGLLLEGLALDPTYETFVLNYVHVHRRWARTFFEQRDPDRAFAVFDLARRHPETCRDMLQAELAEVNGHGLRLLERGRFEEAVVLFDRAMSRQPDAKRLQDNRRAAVMRWAQPALESGDYAEAIRRTTYGAQPGRLHPSLANHVHCAYRRWISSLHSAGRHNEADHVARQALAAPYLKGEGERR